MLTRGRIVISSVIDGLLGARYKLPVAVESISISISHFWNDSNASSNWTYQQKTYPEQNFKNN